MGKIFVEAIGWLATIFFLSGYYLVSRKKIPADGKAFNLINLFGAILYLAYSIANQIYPLLVFEIIFIIVIAKLLYGIYFEPKESGSGILRVEN